MDWITVLLGALMFIAAIAALGLKKLGRARTAQHAHEPWPLFAKKPLTEPEQILYHRLVSALPECIVLAQVQLSRFLGIKQGSPRIAWLNRINQKSADFVVCLSDLTVVAVVELDDSSHLRAARQRADADKNKALASAGVHIVRWNVKSLPDEAAIRAAFTA